METTVFGKASPPLVLANLPGEADRTTPVNRNTGVVFTRREPTAATDKTPTCQLVARSFGVADCEQCVPCTHCNKRWADLRTEADNRPPRVRVHIVPVFAAHRPARASCRRRSSRGWRPR